MRSLYCAALANVTELSSKSPRPARLQFPEGQKRWIKSHRSAEASTPHPTPTSAPNPCKESKFSSLAPGIFLPEDDSPQGFLKRNVPVNRIRLPFLEGMPAKKKALFTASTETF
jgi:hypothetical protein